MFIIRAFMALTLCGSLLACKETVVYEGADELPEDYKASLASHRLDGGVIEPFLRKNRRDGLILSYRYAGLSTHNEIDAIIQTNLDKHVEVWAGGSPVPDMMIFFAEKNEQFFEGPLGNEIFSLLGSKETTKQKVWQAVNNSNGCYMSFLGNEGSKIVSVVFSSTDPSIKNTRDPINCALKQIVTAFGMSIESGPTGTYDGVFKNLSRRDLSSYDKLVLDNLISMERAGGVCVAEFNGKCLKRKAF